MEKATKLAEKAKGSLDKLVDTVKLKAHLASMDSKEVWDKFEKQFDIIREDLRRFSDNIKQEKDEATLQGHLALMDAKERWEAVRDDVDQLVTSISENTEEKVDHVQVKIALAKLEARELIDEAKYKKSFQKLGLEVKEEWYSFLSKIDERVVDFINRFPLK